MSHGTLSRAAWPLVLVLMAFLAVLAVRPVGAQSSGGGPRWEYRVFAMNPGDYGTTEDYKEILAQHGNDATKADAPFQEHVLKYLGEEGWELVALERPRPNLVHFVLKRPAK
jgi:hypothetical protein